MDHGVHRPGSAQELAFQFPPVDLDRHGLREVALRHGADDARGFTHRMSQRIDQVVHRLDPLCPGSGDQSKGHAFVDLALAPDETTHTAQLGCRMRHEFRDVVERIRHFAGDAGPRERKTNTEIAILDGHQGRKDPFGVKVFLCVAIAGRASLPAARRRNRGGSRRAAAGRRGLHCCVRTSGRDQYLSHSASLYVSTRG